MVHFYNFMMTNEGTMSQRVRYNLLDVLGDVGGLYTAVFSIFATFFTAYNHKRNAIKILQAVEGDEDKYPRCLSLRCYLYETKEAISSFC